MKRTSCSCCGLVLDNLSTNPQQQNEGLCMWCETSLKYKAAFEELDQMLEILEKFSIEYKVNWSGCNHGKAMIGNIILISIKDLSVKYNINISERLTNILQKFMPEV